MRYDNRPFARYRRHYVSQCSLGRLLNIRHSHAITHLITFWCVTNHAPRLVVETLKKETVNKRVPKQNHEGFDDTTTYLLYFL